MRLAHTPGLSTESRRLLLGQFGLPQALFSTPRAALARAVGFDLATQLLAPPEGLLAETIERSARWLAREDRLLLTWDDERFPKSLLEIPDPPLLLYVQGNIAGLAEVLGQTYVGVIGSASASRYGRSCAREIVEGLSGRVGIAGELRPGIGAEALSSAHRAASNAPTVATFSPGIVPRARTTLVPIARQVAAQGCLIAEHLPGPQPVPAGPNRLLAGLSRAVVIIEASAHSESIETAIYAAEIGRDVMAVPGSIHAPLSAGSHRLIRQGAKLVESATDVMAELERPV